METTQPANSKPQPIALLSQLALQIANNRPGLQTTEFALVAILLVVELIFASLGKIPPSLATLSAGFEVYGYQYLRNHRKGKREDSILNLVDLVAKSTASDHLVAVAAAVAVPESMSADLSPVVRIPIEQHPTMTAAQLAFFMNQNPDVTHVIVPASSLPVIPTAEPAGQEVTQKAKEEDAKASAVEPPVGGSGVGHAIIGLLLIGSLAFSGCAQTPYYVSGINGTVDTTKDGSGITGGGVGITISPNPYYPLPKGKGFAK